MSLQESTMPAIRGTKPLVWSNILKHSPLEQTPKAKSLHQKVQRPSWGSLWDSYTTYIFLHAYQNKNRQSYDSYTLPTSNATKCINIRMLIPGSLMKTTYIWGILTFKTLKKWLLTYFCVLLRWELGRVVWILTQMSSYFLKGGKLPTGTQRSISWCCHSHSQNKAIGNTIVPLLNIEFAK